MNGFDLNEDRAVGALGLANAPSWSVIE